VVEAPEVGSRTFYELSRFFRIRNIEEGRSGTPSRAGYGGSHLFGTFPVDVRRYDDCPMPTQLPAQLAADP
jgi:hypothetical protein